MFKMSFYKGNLDRDKAIDFIKKTKKPCTYTIGLKYKNPTTKDIFITKEQAIEIINNESWLDITEYKSRIDLNSFNSNDMW